MLRQVLLLLSSVTLAFALGNGRGQYYSQQSFGQGQISQQHVSAGFDSSQAANAVPSPYSFAYEAQADRGGSSRQESSDASGKVAGSYSLYHEDGSKRIVKYDADHQGFRAVIDTDEQGTKSDNPARVVINSAAPAETPMKYTPYQTKSNGYVASGPQVTQYGGGRVPENGKPSPYSFSYNSQFDDGSSSHSESSDGSGKVKGSYSLSNKDGRKRVVDYSADADGFTAAIQTNEFGTKSENPAHVSFLSSVQQSASKAASGAGSYSSSSWQQQAQKQPVSYASQPADEGRAFPYSFNYADQWDDGSSSRSESSDGSGKVAGSYSLSGKDGRHRNVEYTADAGGFRAIVQTNEFGTKSDSPADVRFTSTAALDAPAASQRQPSSYTSSATPKFSSAYSPISQASYQPVQYSGGAAVEGKPSPYSFNYDNQWDDGGSFRKETADGSGKVSGSYGLSVADGRSRTVDYSADAGGFRASVQTNEFGTKSDSPANVQFYSSAAAEAPEQKKAHTYSASYNGQRSYSSNGQKSYSSNGQKSYSSYGQHSQVQQQPIQFNLASAPEGKPAPYSFAYQSQLDDGSNAHSETSDGSGKVSGSYSLSAQDGRQRTVDYSADVGGFKASVQTNEFGTKSDSPADVKFYSSAADISAPSRNGFGYSASASAKGSSSAQFNGASAAYRPQGQPSPVAAAPSPYQFGYSAEAGGGASSRNEASDSSGKVTGSYSVTNEDGSTRLVEYIADEQGFRAKVKTNEPGTKSDSPADVTLESAAPSASYQSQAQSYSGASKFPARTHTSKSSGSSPISQGKIW